MFQQNIACKSIAAKKILSSLSRIVSEVDFKGFIFDCDGTIADSMPHHFEAWRNTLIQKGAKFDFTWDVFYSLAGLGLHDTVHKINERFNESFDSHEIEELRIKNFNKTKHLIRPIEEVLRCARELAGSYPIAIASSGVRDEVEYTLDTIGASDLFSVLVTKDDVTRSKPAPDIFLLAANKLRVKPSSCLVFEDSLIGIEAANNANMKSIYIDPEKFSTKSIKELQ